MAVLHVCMYSTRQFVTARVIARVHAKTASAITICTDTVTRVCAGVQTGRALQTLDRSHTVTSSKSTTHSLDGLRGHWWML